jgi:uncharacterized protein (TIGR00299 family) protein
VNILYYDCFAGISGDMNLAAMIDLGVDPDFLRAELGKLGLDQAFELRVAVDYRHGIRGTRVDVVLKDQPGDQAHDHVPAHAHGHPHDQAQAHAPVHDHDNAQAHIHDHAHVHGHDHTDEHAHGHDHADDHGHDHGHDHSHDHAHGHGRAASPHVHGPHRNLADIEAIIRQSRLEEAVKETSLRIFRKVAAAEARVHGKPLNVVHFHEVGAVDSIVDIVGAAICYHALGVDAVWASPVELGGGFVRCAHGHMPVPAPATVEILHGLPTTRGATPHETTTPTGAAILAVLAEAFPERPELTTQKTGYGIGHRDTEIPNILRVHLASPTAAAGSKRQARLLSCNIDDMTAELLGAAMDILMEQGAMDVHFTPVVMKKNRPGTCLSLLCGAADEARFTDLLFRHTTTLGVKSFPLEKTELERSFERIDTPLGPVTLKHALRDGKVIRSKPEFEDCRAIAKRHGLTLAEVYAGLAGCKP